MTEFEETFLEYVGRIAVASEAAVAIFMRLSGVEVTDEELEEDDEELEEGGVTKEQLRRLLDEIDQDVELGD